MVGKLSVPNGLACFGSIKRDRLRQCGPAITPPKLSFGQSPYSLSNFVETPISSCSLVSHVFLHNGYSTEPATAYHHGALHAHPRTAFPSKMLGRWTGVFTSSSCIPSVQFGKWALPSAVSPDPFSGASLDPTAQV